MSTGIPRRWRSLKLTILAVVALVALLAIVAGLIEKGLWMQAVGYSSVFWTLLSCRWNCFVRPSPSPFSISGSTSILRRKLPPLSGWVIWQANPQLR